MSYSISGNYKSSLIERFAENDVTLTPNSPWRIIDDKNGKIYYQHNNGRTQLAKPEEGIREDARRPTEKEINLLVQMKQVTGFPGTIVKRGEKFLVHLKGKIGYLSTLESLDDAISFYEEKARLDKKMIDRKYFDDSVNYTRVINEKSINSIHAELNNQSDRQKQSQLETVAKINLLKKYISESLPKQRFIEDLGNSISNSFTAVRKLQLSNRDYIGKVHQVVDTLVNNDQDNVQVRKLDKMLSKAKNFSQKIVYGAIGLGLVIIILLAILFLK